MKYLSVVLALAMPAIMGGVQPDHEQSATSVGTITNAATTLSPNSTKETILLVSLDDGSVIKQTISSSADICFKSNSDSSTTCLTQGDPIIDSATNAIIGFEMIEDRINLVGKTN